MRNLSNDPPAEEGSVRYNPETGTYRSAFDATTIDPSIAVVNVMATVCDTKPVQLAPLYEAIDPEAIDRLFTKPPNGHADGDCIIKFSYLGYRVCVKSYGVIEVRPLPADKGGEDE